MGKYVFYNNHTERVVTILRGQFPCTWLARDSKHARKIFSAKSLYARMYSIIQKPPCRKGIVNLCSFFLDATCTNCLHLYKRAPGFQ